MSLLHDNKKAQALRRLASIVESSDDAIISKSLDGVILTWNAAAERIYGYKAKEVVGKSISIIVPPEHADELPEILAKIRKGERIPQYETTRIRKDGRPVTVSVSISPLKDDDGEVVGASAIARDMTGLKRATERIHQLNRLLWSVQQINELIIREMDAEKLVQEACEILTKTRDYEGAYLVVLDDDGEFVTSGQAGRGPRFEAAAEEMSRGALPACIRQAASRSDFAIVSPPEELCEQCPLRDGEPARHVVSINLRHAERTLGVLNIYLRQSGDVGLEESGLLHELAGDIALALDKIRIEADREKLRQQFLQAQKMEALGRMAGGLAHDFRNQLTVIAGHSELLLTNAAAQGPLRSGLTEILNAARRAEQLTSQLLAFSRKQPLMPETFEVDTVIGELAGTVSRLLGEDLELSLGLSAESGTVSADRSQLEQALMNLASNARDAMPDGGRLHIETARKKLDETYVGSHGEVRPGDYVMVAVSDTGCGMDDKTLAKIFEPFFTTKQRGKGTGLGLAMVYSFVKQSGGSVFVYSEPGRGTTFRLYLPLAGKTDAAPADQAPAEQDQPHGTETVLLVEDDEAVRGLTCRVLEGFGYTVLQAGDPKQALALAQENSERIDMLLTDVVMPDASGPELAERILTRIADLRVLFTSGYTGEEIHRLGLAGPGVNLLPKPFNAGELARAVRRTLDAAKGPPQSH